MPGLDDLIKCGFCNSTLKDPLVLPCLHSFCKACLSANTSSGKVTCKTCLKVHPVTGGSVEKAFKVSELANFFLDFKGEKFQVEGEDSSLEGVCSECSPPTNKKPDPKAPPPVNKKLSTCHHCKKVICDDCRNKHYAQQRTETVKALEKFEEGSFNIKTTSGKC